MNKGETIVYNIKPTSIEDLSGPVFGGKYTVKEIVYTTNEEGEEIPVVFLEEYGYEKPFHPNEFRQPNDLLKSVFDGFAEIYGSKNVMKV